MPAVQCPIPGCDYVTDDLDAAIVAVLITVHSTTHAPGPVTAAKVEKVKRPVISTAGTSEEWAYFESRWSDYVEATKIAGRDKVVQLLECCDEQLRKDLTRSAGGSLTNKPVQEVLAAIKKLAVRKRIRWWPESHFIICAKTCPTCNTDVNYTDTIIRDVLARGISDPEIQLDLLGDKNQDMTLEEVTQFVEAKDSGKRSASRLLDSQTVQAASSSYKKAKQTAVRDKNEVCTYCGKKGHGKSAPARLRKSDCPAYGHKCGYCNREHHFEKVCRSKEKSKTGTATHNTDDCEDTWISKASQPQPFVNLVLRILPEDYEAFGFNMTKEQNTVAISAMADTGCQSCLAGIKVIHRLGINQTELIPVNMKMHAANNKGITILGATILRISGRDDQGRHVETRQMTYVTDNSDKLFISREACIALRMISDSFPTIGEIDDTQQTLGTENSHNITNNIGSVNSLDTTCNCPQRKLPPPMPRNLPYPATEDNLEKIKQFLMDYYKSSTFNTCDHQPLPLMDGPPMRLMVDPEAEPVAHHTPVPVPIHWKEEVKAGLDQDVRLGVLEPVPVGEPVTWCHKMVVCAKKNGKPRRTVDFQPLNVHATRETHHTPSPFHQARSVPNGKRKTTAPQGYIASGDAYTRRYDEIVADIPNKTKCVDDVLLWADSIEESFFQAVQWLDICGRHGITLNPEKFIFGQDIVEFAGFEITSNTVRPCMKYLKAILDFPTPRNITDVRSWFGLVNQVSYAFSMADKMLPFRQLLKPGTPFFWDEHINKLFEESKAAIISEIEEGVASLIKVNRHVLLQIGQKLVSASGYFRNIVPAKEVNHLL
ncbi:unnamed protein product [Mytilus edulis]|uniref:Uncharacterized protein n=1 Tax=Mytilus edulis TaxID=6550 RepID=A0A8S3SG22_MYTED|nr:unnamed protein product [Mytilus edulis]